MPDPAYYLPDIDGHLTASCWCERTLVAVPAEHIARGLTGSCGPSCTPEGPTCEHCGQPLTGQRRYCRTRCRNAAARNRRRTP